jgi:uncharacterized protein YvpB
MSPSSRLNPRARRRRTAAAGITVLLVAAGCVHALSGTGASRRTAAGTPPAPQVALGQARGLASPAPSAVSRGSTPVPASDAVPTTGSVLVDVPTQGQLPLLPNGCEVTSLSMLLTFAGHPADKLVLSRAQDTDLGQPVFSGRPGDFYGISRWGDPNESFVGRVQGYGYGIYHGPLARLLDRQLPGRSVDVTGRPFSEVLARLRAGAPTVLWTTTTFRPPTRWVTWATPNGPFRGTQVEHAVLLVGYASGRLVVNNPLSGRRESVAAGPFVASWQQMGRQALTVTSSG